MAPVCMDRTPSHQLQQSKSVTVLTMIVRRMHPAETRVPLIGTCVTLPVGSLTSTWCIIHTALRLATPGQRKVQKEMWTAMWYSRILRAASRPGCRSQEGANAFDFAFVCVNMIIRMAISPHARQIEGGDATSMWLCTRVATFKCRPITCSRRVRSLSSLRLIA